MPGTEPALAIVVHAPLISVVQTMVGLGGRVVLDTIEALFGMFNSEAIVRAELVRLFRWLKDRAVTAVVTGERSENDPRTRYGIEQYVSDCVIALEHSTQAEISTRRLQVVKYRGSAHETNQYPFLITDRGFEVPPVTSVALDYGAPSERSPPACLGWTRCWPAACSGDRPCW